ncbi:hypothetical protein PCYB_093380 [Plasmodium cynomolgi strain B]|uniref:Uncharacterized protein n=1 Tax=Plasmodium cynomolgi (strain B) TaxID=1120755 RepID=K6UK68_PLACD|nr:hypothetical protein PCYB_093380 [Plasmodium cynomolgi strain B]GAB66553.1 hypothetical protein PCYB_093380 [Plasmodium cynomolgi strain B]
MKSHPPLLVEMIKKGASTTLSTVQGGDHTKCEDGRREGNNNYGEDDSTNSVGCEGAYNSDSCEDKSTCASSIGKSVHIINASFSRIKKNLSDINKAIELDIDSEGETGDEFGGQSEAQSEAQSEDQSDAETAATVSSNDSSVVRTFHASNGNSEYDHDHDENGDGDDEGEDRKRSKQLQLLLNNVINTKLEKKKIGTLDIIDECISMKNDYTSGGEKREDGGEEESCAFVVDGVPRGISYAQSVDLREVENLGDLLAGMAACEEAGDFAVDADAPTDMDVVDLKDPGAVTSEGGAKRKRKAKKESEKGKRKRKAKKKSEKEKRKRRKKA